ncbi:hypothetical protein [Vibrio japonicus]|uniref:Glycosyl transferase n=1 Tax=Vibrio japonicus TaxID=1824638 RepID=A0ABY5LHU3_9VIBR|nr:hypothetical protein [Vibrio japonicus]UUM30480.1 hypothetical protein NP165_12470 [Vibrio japonicus]
MSAKKYLTFVIYGNDKTYYQGAKFCILSFLANWQGSVDSRPEVVVLAEETEHFSDLPIRLFAISPEQKSEWSLNNTYHFRIKNRGLKYLCEQLPLNKEDQLLFLDTDTYFTQPTNIYFDSISSQQSLMFFPEVNINSLPDTNEYAVIRNKDIVLQDGSTYRVNPESTMWASAVIGITGGQADAFDYADQLIQALRKEGCTAHTLEQFALSEALTRVVSLAPAKSWLNHYSTSGRKNWGRKVLEQFFTDHRERKFEDLLKQAKSVSFTRPLSEVIRGHIYKKSKKIKEMFSRNKP